MRQALSELRSALSKLGLSEDRLPGVELAVAEALNNIVEHAFPGEKTGDVRIDAALSGKHLCVTLIDTGRPLPNGRPPVEKRPNPDVERQDLPEGGFGWHLIRDLTDLIAYTRAGEENRLQLHFGLPDRPEKQQTP